jgi:hypothetical protein
MGHTPVDEETAAAFNCTADESDSGDDELEGPDSNNLRLDMSTPPGSLWNQEVLRILVRKFREMGAQERQMPDDAVRYALKYKLKRLRAEWKAGNPRYKNDGNVETIEEIEDRLGITESNRLKQNRRTNRRLRVS